MIKVTDDELFHNEWVSTRIIKSPEQGVKGYVYTTETRCNGRIISIMPFRRVPQVEGKVKGHSTTFQYKPDGSIFAHRIEYLLKSEATPCWGITNPIGNVVQKFWSTLTGGVEGHGIQSAVLNELKEEAGYTVTRNDLIFLGTCFASKSSDTIYQLYSVDLTDKEQGEANGDGSELEKQSEAIWALEDKILKCQDPLASVLFLRLQEYLKKPHAK